jgi:L-threonylcarbamoyladenylate synthase
VNTEVIQTDTKRRFDAAVEKAVALLKAGHPVALPTETVYGLAANALDLDSVAKIFGAKGRPSHNPIIVHVASLEMAISCAKSWPEPASLLVRAFWPGPLTVVVEKSAGIPGIVTAGGATVGIRWPSHPFIQAVIKACGFPLAAPSANRSNELSPTNAEHVLKSLRGRVPLIVDGGQCQVGIESTVVDLTEERPRILRPGMVNRESIRAVIGTLDEQTEGGAMILKSPGMLKKHYAPKAALKVVSWENDKELRNHAETLDKPLRDIFVLSHTRIPSTTDFGRVSVIPHDVEAFARAIYGELHECDAAGAKAIIVEKLPDSPEWAGIADRLMRAAAA